MAFFKVRGKGLLILTRPAVLDIKIRNWVVFCWWLNPVRLHSLYKILYPKRRIESYYILGTIVSPKTILLNCSLHSSSQKLQGV